MCKCFFLITHDAQCLILERLTKLSKVNKALRLLYHALSSHFLHRIFYHPPKEYVQGRCSKILAWLGYLHKLPPFGCIVEIAERNKETDGAGSATRHLSLCCYVFSGGSPVLFEKIMFSWTIVLFCCCFIASINIMCAMLPVFATRNLASSSPIVNKEPHIPPKKNYTKQMYDMY